MTNNTIKTVYDIERTHSLHLKQNIHKAKSIKGRFKNGSQPTDNTYCPNKCERATLKTISNDNREHLDLIRLVWAATGSLQGLLRSLFNFLIPLSPNRVSNGSEDHHGPKHGLGTNFMTE
jgi:hypothetical protein